MSIQDRDFLLRLIRQLAEAIARIAGLREAGKHDEALALLRETGDEFLGPMARTMEQVDASSAAMLLSSSGRIRAYASLIEERAKVHAARGDGARARADDLRALQLYLLTTNTVSPLPAEVLRSIEALASRVDPGRLDPPLRAVLDSIAPLSRRLRP